MAIGHPRRICGLTGESVRALPLRPTRDGAPPMIAGTFDSFPARSLKAIGENQFAAPACHGLRHNPATPLRSRAMRSKLVLIATVPVLIIAAVASPAAAQR